MQIGCGPATTDSSLSELPAPTATAFTTHHALVSVARKNSPSRDSRARARSSAGGSSLATAFASPQCLAIGSAGEQPEQGLQGPRPVFRGRVQLGDPQCQIPGPYGIGRLGEQPEQ
jgi:hypothetical protein